jgi:hypothetical protein
MSNQKEKERYYQKIESIKQKINIHPELSLNCPGCKEEKCHTEFVKSYKICKECSSKRNKEANKKRKENPKPITIENKVCPGCKEQKNIIEFSNTLSYCKECIKVKCKQSYKNNPDYFKQRAQEYRQYRRENNIVQQVESKTCTLCKTVQPITCYSKVGGGFFNGKCKKCRAIEEKDRRKVHRENGTTPKRPYKPIENPNKRLLHICRKRVLDIVKRKRVKKSAKTTEMIGIDEIILTQWIMYNCKIDNFDFNEKDRRRVWHIDHVIPCNWFDFSSKEGFIQCFHWTNMVPLSQVNNSSKGDFIIASQIKLVRQRLKSFMTEQNIDYDKEMYHWNNTYKHLVKSIDKKYLKPDFIVAVDQ